MTRVYNPMQQGRNRAPEQFKITATRIVHETDNAICIEVLDGAIDAPVWFPLSQVHSIHRSEPPVLYVTPWIAKQKGLL